MSNLVPQNFGAVSTKFAQQPVVDDLSSGIQSSFGIIGYKGKVWSIRYRGEEQALMRDDGDGPRNSIEVVILKSSQHISKIWYEQGYVEGSNAAPDCFSNNGIAPEPTSAKKQSDSCALCPHNQWGSRVTPAGKQGKSCADSKRLAVVPQADIENELYGGPMLLRVPAASLQDLAHYGQKMQQMGYPYYSVATKISFDPAESYPKFLLNAFRPLTDAEADIVLATRDGHAVNRILSESEFVAAAPAAAATPAFEQTATGQPVGTTQAATPVQPSPVGTGEQPQVSQTTQAAPPVEPVKSSGFGATAPVAEATPEVTKQAVAPAVEPVQEVESDEDREERELMEKMAAIKAKKAAAAKAGNAPAKPATEQTAAPASTQANGGTSHSTTGQTATTAASPSNDGGPQNVAAGFEADLDSMLANLLPAAT